MSKSIEQLCVDKGLRMTGQRRVIVSVLSDNFKDGGQHPDADELYEKVVRVNPRVSLATIYRTLRLLEEEQILAKIEFGDGRKRYENANRKHHDHLIDVETGKVIEFRDDGIEALQKKIATQLGYKLIHHKLQLFCTPLKKISDNKKLDGDNS